MTIYTVNVDAAAGMVRTLDAEGIPGRLVVVLGNTWGEANGLAQVVIERLGEPASRSGKQTILAGGTKVRPIGTTKAGRGMNAHLAIIPGWSEQTLILHASAMVAMGGGRVIATTINTPQAPMEVDTTPGGDTSPEQASSEASEPTGAQPDPGAQ